MTPVGRIAEPSEDLADLAASMLDTGSRTVPVLDGGCLVGVVTRRDVLRAVARGELTGPGRRAGGRGTPGFSPRRGTAAGR